MVAYRNITVSVREDVIKDLKKIAFDEDCSQKKIINEILLDGVKKRKQ